MTHVSKRIKVMKVMIQLDEDSSVSDVEGDGGGHGTADKLGVEETAFVDKLDASFLAFE
jgi:hypothetical protein